MDSSAMSAMLTEITLQAEGEPDFMIIGVDDICTLTVDAAENPWELRRALRCFVMGHDAERRTQAWLRELKQPKLFRRMSLSAPARQRRAPGACEARTAPHRAR